MNTMTTKALAPGTYGYSSRDHDEALDLAAEIGAAGGRLAIWSTIGYRDTLIHAYVPRAEVTIVGENLHSAANTNPRCVTVRPVRCVYLDCTYYLVSDGHYRRVLHATEEGALTEANWLAADAEQSGRGWDRRN